MDIFQYIPKISKEGYSILWITILVTCGAFFFSDKLGVVLALLSCFVALFFRDPVRYSPVYEGVILSPADGIVTNIGVAPPPPELNMEDQSERKFVSIFLSVFDVHVNRIPVAGEIVKTNYHKGQFISATLDKSSQLNERNTIVIRESASGQDIIVTQIAGLIARRIVSSAEVGAKVTAGGRYGIIKFGSRVDLYLPVDADVRVCVGQRMIGGETIIGNLASSSLLSGKDIKYRSE